MVRLASLRTYMRESASVSVCARSPVVEVAEPLNLQKALAGAPKEGRLREMAQEIRRELINRIDLKRRVITGPIEATAIGNVVIQAIGSGELENLKAARALIRKSFPLETFKPCPQADWDRAYQRYRALPR